MSGRKSWDQTVQSIDRKKPPYRGQQRDEAEDSTEVDGGGAVVEFDPMGAGGDGGGEEEAVGFGEGDGDAVDGGLPAGVVVFREDDEAGLGHAGGDADVAGVIGDVADGVAWMF
jgi:hypothetical protein